MGSGKKATDHGKWFRGRTVEKQIERINAEQEENVINNARRLTQLRRKYLELKIATWIYQRLKPSDEGMIQMEEEAPGPLVLTTEEEVMVGKLRKINRNKGNVLLEKHKRATRTLKRKREQRREDAVYLMALNRATKRTRYFIFSRVNPLSRDYATLIQECERIDALLVYKTVRVRGIPKLIGFFVLRGPVTVVDDIARCFPNFLINRLDTRYDDGFEWLAEQQGYDGRLFNDARVHRNRKEHPFIETKKRLIF